MAKEYAKAFYQSKEWQKCRAGYIKSVHGLCERCGERGKIEPGFIVHHKKHITPNNIDDPDITLSWDNLQYLCHDCHNRVHGNGAEVIREDVMFDEDGNLVER